ncbi:DNA binding [Tyrophagus putrescentiae]|nr:DNA binding [Tyrophagus putrescentiae]
MPPVKEATTHQTDFTKQVLEAVKGTDRGGRASIQAIKKYLVERIKEKLFQFIRDSVASGLLVQVSGSGGTGSVRLSDRGEAVLAAKLRPPPPAPTPPPPPPPSSSTSSPPPPPPPPAPIPTLPVASTSPAPSTAAATSTSTSGDLPVDVPIKIETSAEATAAVVSSAPEVIPLANLPVSRATASSSPSSTQSSPSSLQRQLAELKSQLKSQITEKHQLEEELKRVVNLFRDEETHPGRWCRACFSGPPDFHTSECCQQGTYYCCLACQHRDWRRHMPRCGRVKIEPEEQQQQ